MAIEIRVDEVYSFHPDKNVVVCNGLSVPNVEWQTDVTADVWFRLGDADKIGVPKESTMYFRNLTNNCLLTTLIDSVLDMESGLVTTGRYGYIPPEPMVIEYTLTNMSTEFIGSVLDIKIYPRRDIPREGVIETRMVYEVETVTTGFYNPRTEYDNSNIGVEFITPQGSVVIYPERQALSKIPIKHDLLFDDSNMDTLFIGNELHPISYPPRPVDNVGIATDRFNYEETNMPVAFTGQVLEIIDYTQKVVRDVAYDYSNISFVFEDVVNRYSSANISTQFTGQVLEPIVYPPYRPPIEPATQTYGISNMSTNFTGQVLEPEVYPVYRPAQPVVSETYGSTNIASEFI